MKALLGVFVLAALPSQAAWINSGTPAGPNTSEGFPMYLSRDYSRLGSLWLSLF